MTCRNARYDWPREAATLLIQLYEEHPCLYQPTHQEYHNRNIKIKAIETITNTFNQRKLTKLSTAEIKKKLHGIRTQYQAELQKIKKSETSGAGYDEVYTPKLWCFELLQFLYHGATVVAKGESNMSTKEAQSLTQASALEETPYIGDDQRSGKDDESQPQIIFDGDSQNLDEVEMEVLSPISSTSRASAQSAGQPPLKRRRTTKEKEEVFNLLGEARCTLQHLTTNLNEPNEETQSANMAFALWVGKEMESIKDEEIIENLQEALSQSIFKAKKCYRLKKTI